MIIWQIATQVVFGCRPKDTGGGAEGNYSGAQNPWYPRISVNCESPKNPTYIR